jgi:O-antigen/teichoic acid export membrane protein
MSTGAASKPWTTVGLSFLKLGFGEAMARLIAFGATVYLARTLGADVYGVVVLATAVLLYFTFVTDCGVEALGVREVADRPEALAATLPAILGARLLVAGGLILLTLPVGLFLLPQPEGAILAIYGFTLLPFALGTKWAHLGLEQSGYASLGRMLTELVATVLILVTVRGPDDLARVPLAQVLGEGAGAFLSLRLLPSGVSRLRVVLRAAEIRHLLSRSWPLVLHALLGLAIFNADFIFLRGFRDSAAVGLYAAAYTLVSFFLNLGAAYSMTLLPVLTRLRNDASATKALYDGSMAQVLAGAVPVAVGGFLVADQVVAMVFGAGYTASADPLRILIWTIPVALIRNVSQGALIAYGRQDQLLTTVAWAAGVNVLLNLLFIPRWGMSGAAVATLITEVVRSTLAARYVSRHGLPMASPWRFRRVLLAGAAMAAIIWWVGDRPVLVTVAIGGASYLAALTAVGGIRFRRDALPELVP